MIILRVRLPDVGWVSISDRQVLMLLSDEICLEVGGRLGHTCLLYVFVYPFRKGCVSIRFSLGHWSSSWPLAFGKRVLVDRSERCWSKGLVVPGWAWPLWFSLPSPLFLVRQWFM